MKRILLTILAILILSGNAFAAVAAGTYLQPTLILLGVYTVATLPEPSAGQAGMLAQVNDGASTGDCTTGGGSTWSLCRWSGSAWANAGGGGGWDGTGNVDVSGTVEFQNDVEAKWGTSGNVKVKYDSVSGEMEFLDSSDNILMSLNLTTGALNTGQQTLIHGVESDPTPDTDLSGGSLVAEFTVDSGQTNTVVGQPMHIGADGEIYTSDCDDSSHDEYFCVLGESGTGAKKCIFIGPFRNDACTFSSTLGQEYCVSDDAATNCGYELCDTVDSEGDLTIYVGINTSTHSLWVGAPRVSTKD